MSSPLNPFRPTAGAEPPQIVGRQGILNEFRYGLKIGSGAPGLLTIFTGARGIGKTVMLGEAEDIARREGWAVISETATPGFLGRIGESMRPVLEELTKSHPERRITGLGFAGFSVTTRLEPEQQLGWRRLGERLLKALAEQRTGLLITLDEIHAASREELAQLAAFVQHFIREGLPISLVFAGLPAAVSDLLNDGVATFLRRADRINLHEAALEEVERSYKEVFSTGGFEFGPEVLHEAALATEGYPFMIQLVGYHLWQLAELESEPVTDEILKLAITTARQRNSRLVLEAALANVTARERDFLEAMTVDDEISKVADIRERMDTSPSNAGNLRARLVDAGIIQPAGYGMVEFAVPGLHAYLRNQVNRAVEYRRK